LSGCTSGAAASCRATCCRRCRAASRVQSQASASRCHRRHLLKFPHSSRRRRKRRRRGPAPIAVTALGNAGLEHGRYAIFHRQFGTNREGFSVASLTEPGSFDLEHLDGTTIAGLSFFVVLPGDGDPVARFDAMVETARALSVELAADLFDDSGSSWSSQRERYLREELIEYRHQFERR
jgi:hypothetical protein